MDLNRYRSGIAERREFEAYDKVCTAVITKQAIANLFSHMHGICAAFVKVLKEKFLDHNLTYARYRSMSFLLDETSPSACGKSRTRASRNPLLW